MSNIYRETGCPSGIPKYAYASNNFCVYILMSYKSQQMYNDFLVKYDRNPSSSWLRKHFSFILV